MIQRIFDINKILTPNKVVIIYGPRRVGKSTLLHNFLNSSKLKYKVETGDNIKTQQLFSGKYFDELLDYAKGYDLIAIDEAQQIKDIGNALKILVDNIPNIKVLITGSSSFNISQKVGEPLTGRKRTIILYPFAQQELVNNFNKFEVKNKLEDFLIYGSYPEVFTSNIRNDKIEILLELVNSYLLKDVFTLERVKGARQFVDLLKLIAFQVGIEVSVNELANSISLDSKTVARYLDLLEKSFVIKKLTTYSSNLRSEISSKCKYYFYDNGIRNAIISQFNKLTDRNDIGALFENFIIMERIKLIDNNRLFINQYFWRNYAGQEIDIIEEKDGKLTPFEIKYSEKAKIKNPSQWYNNYKTDKIKVINRNNYTDFVSTQENYNE